jgi:hypothetical protein
VRETRAGVGRDGARRLVPGDVAPCHRTRGPRRPIPVLTRVLGRRFSSRRCTSLPQPVSRRVEPGWCAGRHVC